MFREKNVRQVQHGFQRQKIQILVLNLTVILICGGETGAT